MSPDREDGLYRLQLLTWMRMLSPSERREIRLGKRLSQSDVARACGVTVGAVCRWESERGRRPRGDKAVVYAEVLAGLQGDSITLPPEVQSEIKRTVIPVDLTSRRRSFWRGQRVKNGPALFWWQERFG